MSGRVEGSLVIENAKIVFRNFAGEEGEFNRKGDRNFCVILEPDVAEQMAADGWNVKKLKDREIDGEVEIGSPYIQVSVGFKGRPPQLVLISSRGRTTLAEEECEMFDWVEIRNADLMIRPYNWEVNGSSGVKAYLQSLFVTMEESVLDLKYADVPDVPQSNNDE